MTDRADKPSKPPALRIREIRVTKPFGLYNHVIPLNQDARVTILHGPNGVGKTVLLRMLRALLGGNPNALAETPFESLDVIFTDGSQVKVTPVDDSTRVACDWLDTQGNELKRPRPPAVHMIEEQRLLFERRHDDEGVFFHTTRAPFLKTVDVNARQLQKVLDQNLAHYAKRQNVCQ